MECEDQENRISKKYAQDIKNQLFWKIANSRKYPKI